MKSIETRRLILRQFKPSDIDDMWEYCSDPLVGPNAGWPVHQNREFTLEKLTDFIIRNETSNDTVYAIHDKEDQKVIGSIGLHKRNPGNYYDVELGYVLSSKYWSKGIMTEACRALIEHVFTETENFRISVSHFSTNMRSARVIDKLGFKHEGTMRKARITLDGAICDSIKYGMLKEEFLEIYKKWEKEDES